MSLSNDTHKAVESWIETYARMGYGAKGVVYGTVGVLALLEAFDLKWGETVGSEGVLKRIAAQPFGQVLLLVLAISLIGYVTWRFVQAALDPEHSHEDISLKNIVRRISYVASGIAYLGLAFSAGKIIFASSESGGDSAQAWALKIMQMPFGRLIAGAAGLIFVGIGGYYFYRAAKAHFCKRFKLHHMSDDEKFWATVVGRVGIAARGVVYAVIGCYGLKAAWNYDPSQIKTTEDVLALFEGNPTDEWILATLGVGFIAYGIHMGFQSAYRRIDPM